MPVGRPLIKKTTQSLRRVPITPPRSRNDSNSETRSAKEILLQLDSNFSRAVGILNKYMPSEESATYNPNDLNQNKAVGSESDLLSSPQVNSPSGSRSGKNYIESEQRGGSTMSDLHNTEYVDESKDVNAKLSPNVKTLSDRASDLFGSPTNKLGTPTTTTTTRRMSGRPGSMDMNPSFSPNPRNAPRPYSSSPMTASSSQSRREDTLNKSSRTYPSLMRSMDRRRKKPEIDINDLDLEPESDDDDDISGGSGHGDDESGTASTYTNYLLDADPSAARDLDNASPKTLALCRKHACHYCVFVYFPSHTVDEDLMPFRRKAFMDKVARIQNPEHVREVRETRCARDAYADRRIKCIERQSGTQIRLSELDPTCAFIKGLPRRRLTIAGPTFAHITCALNLFETLLPRVIKNAIFPYRLPEGISTRFPSGTRISSVHQWSHGRADGTVFLRSQLDDRGGWRSFLSANRDL